MKDADLIFLNDRSYKEPDHVVLHFELSIKLVNDHMDIHKLAHHARVVHVV